MASESSHFLACAVGRASGLAGASASALPAGPAVRDVWFWSVWFWGMDRLLTEEVLDPLLLGVLGGHRVATALDELPEPPWL